MKVNSEKTELMFEEPEALESLLQKSAEET